MDKLLQDHRKRFGEFEVIEFVDTAEIQRLNDQLAVDVPMELHWTWEYGSEVEELRQLYERGKRGQWNAESDIDWSIPFPREEWFLPKQGGSLLANLDPLSLAGGLAFLVLLLVLGIMATRWLSRRYRGREVTPRFR
jgi:hypothetical protein